MAGAKAIAGESGSGGIDPFKFCKEVNIEISLRRDLFLLGRDGYTVTVDRVFAVMEIQICSSFFREDMII